MECGSRRCPSYTFCHEATNACKDCSEICHPERQSHYEPRLCLEQCQGYMFEQLRSHAYDGTARTLGAVSLGLSVVALLGVLLLAGLVLCCVFRWPGMLLRLLRDKAAANHCTQDKLTAGSKNKCDISRALDSSVYTVSGSISESELRTHAMPQQPPAPAPVPVAVAPPIPPPPARHPSEDSTLDYAAYDNPALSPSSSPLPGTQALATHRAVDAVLNAVLDSSLPGAVPAQNGHVRQIESSF